MRQELKKNRRKRRPPPPVGGGAPPASVCVLAGAPCPKTDDEHAPRFCPHWKSQGIPEHHRDGSGRVITSEVFIGCQLRRIIPYLQSVATEADHGHAAANEARDAAIKTQVQIERAQQNFAAALLPILFNPAPDQIRESAGHLIEGAVGDVVEGEEVVSEN